MTIIIIKLSLFFNNKQTGKTKHAKLIVGLDESKTSKFYDIMKNDIVYNHCIKLK